MILTNSWSHRAGRVPEGPASATGFLSLSLLFFQLQVLSLSARMRMYTVCSTFRFVHHSLVSSTRLFSLAERLNDTWVFVSNEKNPDAAVENTVCNDISFGPEAPHKITVTCNYRNIAPPRRGRYVVIRRLRGLGPESHLLNFCEVQVMGCLEGHDPDSGYCTTGFYLPKYVSSNLSGFCSIEGMFLSNFKNKQLSGKFKAEQHDHAVSADCRDVSVLDIRKSGKIYESVKYIPKGSNTFLCQRTGNKTVFPRCK